MGRGEGGGRVDQLAALDCAAAETVVDIGGGNGSLLRGLLDRVPGLRGTCSTSRRRTATRRSSTSDCLVPGSFFEHVPQGDVYVLSAILHDWDDERATAILRTIRTAAPPTRALLVLDAVVPSGNEPHGAKWLDVLMLTLLDGRERDEEQWRALLGRGLRADADRGRLIEGDAADHYCDRQRASSATSPRRGGR